MTSNQKRHIIFSHVDLKKQKSLPEDVTAKKSGAMVNIYVYMSWTGRPFFFHPLLYLNLKSLCTLLPIPFLFEHFRESSLLILGNPTNLALVMQLAKVSRTTSSGHD
jgi:hypothetical protein